MECQPVVKVVTVFDRPCTGSDCVAIGEYQERLTNPVNAPPPLRGIMPPNS